jgi:hypothetical protein
MEPIPESPPVGQWPFSVQSPYREALARWPEEWRERWGHRANALQDSGLHWRTAEVKAFIEVWNQRHAMDQATADASALAS